MATPPTVIVVVKRTAYRLYVEEEHDERVVRLLEKDDPSVSRVRLSHEEHEATVQEVRDALDELGVRANWVRRAHAPFDAQSASLVVTVGGDGTLLGASHHIGNTPILGINSAPHHSVGFFCGAAKGCVLEAIRSALEGELPAVVLARMSVLLNGKSVSDRVLNDALFCHRSPAATSRYFVSLGSKSEDQKSSGFWIGPAAGSTAAQRSAGGRVLPLTSLKLQYVVREPYTPVTDPLRLLRLLVPDGRDLTVRCEMREGQIFLDGPHKSLAVEVGDQLVFRRSPESLRVLALHRPRRSHSG